MGIPVYKILNSIENEQYCIVKPSDELPNYISGQDIDLFCFDNEVIIRNILKYGNSLVKKDFNIVLQNINDCHVQVDFFYDNKIDIKFDLYNCLPKYEKIKLKASLFESVIENAIVLTKRYRGYDIKYRVPSLIDDAILRYIEFIEYYDVRPSKIKHLEYLLDRVHKEDIKKFLDKLHYYTTIPKSYGKKYKMSWIPSVLYRFKNKTMMEIILVVIKKFNFFSKKLILMIKKRLVYICAFLKKNKGNFRDSS